MKMAGQAKNCDISDRIIKNSGDVLKWCEFYFNCVSDIVESLHSLTSKNLSGGQLFKELANSFYSSEKNKKFFSIDGTETNLSIFLKDLNIMDDDTIERAQEKFYRSKYYKKSQLYDRVFSDFNKVYFDSLSPIERFKDIKKIYYETLKKTFLINKEDHMLEFIDFACCFIVYKNSYKDETFASFNSRLEQIFKKLKKKPYAFFASLMKENDNNVCPHKDCILCKQVESLTPTKL